MASALLCSWPESFPVLRKLNLFLQSTDPPGTARGPLWAAGSCSFPGAFLGFPTGTRTPFSVEAASFEVLQSQWLCFHHWDHRWRQSGLFFPFSLSSVFSLPSLLLQLGSDKRYLQQSHQFHECQERVSSEKMTCKFYYTPPLIAAYQSRFQPNIADQILCMPGLGAHGKSFLLNTVPPSKIFLCLVNEKFKCKPCFNPSEKYIIKMNIRRMERKKKRGDLGAKGKEEGIRKPELYWAVSCAVLLVVVRGCMSTE